MPSRREGRPLQQSTARSAPTLTTTTITNNIKKNRRPSLTFLSPPPATFDDPQSNARARTSRCGTLANLVAYLLIQRGLRRLPESLQHGHGGSGIGLFGLLQVSLSRGEQTAVRVQAAKKRNKEVSRSEVSLLGLPQAIAPRM